MPFKVFLSYAREDQNRVEEFYERLSAERFEPWMDVKKLLPGQNWELEIDHALRDANVVIAWLSNSSVSKRGFVQREAQFAIEQLRYKLPTDIYFIPVLLEACEVPTHLAIRQYIDINTPGAWEQLTASLRLAATQQSIALDHGTPQGPYNILTKLLSESRDGHPGHNIEIEFPHFTSAALSNTAQELSAFFEGRARAQFIANRSDEYDQDIELFPQAGEYYSTNGYWEHFQLAYVTETLVSAVIGISTYGAGAAHPNHNFESFNFITANGLRQFTLDELFIDPYTAEQELSRICIEQISREYWQRTGELPDQDAADWIARGCSPHEDNFRTFSISTDSLNIEFAPYQVGPYAMGSWDAKVSYYDLLPFLKEQGPYGLINRIGA